MNKKILVTGAGWMGKIIQLNDEKVILIEEESAENSLPFSVKEPVAITINAFPKSGKELRRERRAAERKSKKHSQ